MQPKRLLRTVTGASLVAASVLALAQPANAVTTTQRRVISQASDPTGTAFAGGTGSAHISTDGNWLAFNRLTGNGSYLKSLVSGASELVSLNDADQPANGPSQIEGLSADGSSVLFSTTATNMDEGLPTTRDLYVRSLATDSTERVNLIGLNPSAVKPGESTISDDGKTIAFSTTSFHLYARSLANHVTEQVDVTSAEVPGSGTSGQPSISANGRFITFTSFASDLVAGDTNFVSDIFERDRQAGTTVRVSLSDTEAAPNLSSDHSSVSDDGQSIAFASNATNLVTGDTNTDQDVFVRYLSTQSTLRVSLPTGGAQANGVSGRPDLSSNGSSVAFESTANLDLSSTNPHGAVYFRDISGNLTVLEGKTGSTGPNQASTGASLASANGAVAFDSAATNLIDGDTNGAIDAYVDRWEPLGPFVWFDDLTSTLGKHFDAPASASEPNEVAVENGQLTSGHLIVTLAHAPVWAQHREPVARLYQAFFHRVPDLNGLNYWVKKRQGGTKLGVIAAFFAGSNEFKTAYGNVDNAGFVTLVYGNVLQRKPDAAGLNHWVTKMAGGMSRGDVMVAFSESNEGKRTLAPEVDSTLIGLGMLKTMPSKALWQQAADAHRNHHMAEWGALVYLSSPEFVQLIVK